MKQTILLTGGGGYVGSHTAHLLTQLHYNVIIVDLFLHGVIPHMPWASVIKGDYGDKNLLSTIFKDYKIDAVMHFASFIDIASSSIDPKSFYENNVVKTSNLLNCMIEHSVRNIIFSSSCAVYGNPLYIPIKEEHPFNPMNPYGKTKTCIEYMLTDYACAYGINFCSLRYFNAAGAYPEYNLGEYHNPESHVIPRIIHSLKTKTPFIIFGNDYQTNDGTAIRDYIHVRDIADAHIRALEHIKKTSTSDVFNIGTGYGYSVRELIAALVNIIQVAPPLIWGKRRMGDVDRLIADPSKAMAILGWRPVYSSLDFILRSALKFEEMKESSPLSIDVRSFSSLN